MVHFLNLYKQVKANNEYQRHADKARCPKTKQQGESSRELSHVGSRKGKGMSQYAESEWAAEERGGVLSQQVFCHHISMHGKEIMK